MFSIHFVHETSGKCIVRSEITKQGAEGSDIVRYSETFSDMGRAVCSVLDLLRMLVDPAHTGVEDPLPDFIRKTQSNGGN